MKRTVVRWYGEVRVFEVTVSHGGDEPPDVTIFEPPRAVRLKHYGDAYAVEVYVDSVPYEADLVFRFDSYAEGAAFARALMWTEGQAGRVVFPGGVDDPA